MEWYAVRHVLQHDDLFEERITLWQAASEDDAIARAEVEAADHAATLGEGSEALDLFQSYRLPDPPTDGAEVFSLMRRGSTQAEDYINRFFDTGQELTR
jgi:hypothetical protein